MAHNTLVWYSQIAMAIEVSQPFPSSLKKGIHQAVCPLQYLWSGHFPICNFLSSKNVLRRLPQLYPSITSMPGVRDDKWLYPQCSSKLYTRSGIRCLIFAATDSGCILPDMDLHDRSHSWLHHGTRGLHRAYRTSSQSLKHIIIPSTNCVINPRSVLHCGWNIPLSQAHRPLRWSSTLKIKPKVVHLDLHWMRYIFHSGSGSRWRNGRWR